MIKVTGALNVAYRSPEGNLVQPTTIKTFKRYGWRCKWFIFKCKLFYDWVDVEEIKNESNK